MNVRGLGSSDKSVKIVREINFLNCDIALLQETHVSCRKLVPETEAELNDLLNPLRQLIATAGIKLIAAPFGPWNFDGYAAKLRRLLLVTFSVDAVMTSEEVLEAVYNADVAAE